MKTRITFLLTGCIAGLACVLPGPLLKYFHVDVDRWSGFLCCRGRGTHHHGRRMAGSGEPLAICGGGRRVLHYLLACADGVFAAYGFSPDWFGFRPSANVDQFGTDVWLGLIAAGTTAAVGISLFAALWTGKWSKSLLLRLMTAGIVTIVVTYLINLPFRGYWSFFGALIPVGMALFCGIVGPTSVNTSNLKEQLQQSGASRIIARRDG